MDELTNQIIATSNRLTAHIVVIFIFVLLTGCFFKYVLPSIRNKGKNIKYSRVPHGIIFGKDFLQRRCYSPSASEGHCIVMGGTGLGKTSALLIPTLRSWTGTSLTIDISGDISSNVSMPGSIIFDPSSPDSATYDVFGIIDTLPESEQDEALEQLAHLIMPELPNASANAKYYQDGGRNILKAALVAYYHQGLDFPAICRAVCSNSYASLFASIDNTHIERAIMYINGFQGVDDRNTSGCKQNCDDALDLFVTSQLVSSCVCRPIPGRVSFSPLSLETANCFVVIADAMLETYAPLLHLITAQCLSYLSARPKDKETPVLLCLDEFVSLGKLEITPALRKLRKKKVRIMVLTQSMADLDVLYGHDERMAMLTNFSYKVLLGAGDVDTQKYFADLIGKEDRATTSSTTHGFGLFSDTSHTTGTEQRYIIEPAQLANLGKTLILLTPDGYTKLRKNFYFEN